MRLQNENILLKIETMVNELRPSEQKVAGYVLKNYKEVMFYTVNELASNSGVSVATVMRFVKKLGFKGFQYFKLSLARIPKAEEKDLQVTRSSSINVIKKTIQQNIMTSISDTSVSLNEKDVKKAVDYIINAENIFIAGVGVSGIVARLLAYKLLRMGIFSNYIPDTHLQAMNASLIKSNSLLIGVSHSGSTRDTVDALRIARNAGAKTICITDHVKSPIAEYANVLLCTFAREDPLGISQGRSSISQIYVIETLIASIYLKIREQADKARKITAESVLDKLY